MRATDIVCYLLGREDAIRRVASSRSSVWVGLLLVLMAGIAREYDQTYIPYFGIRFLFPLATSFIAAALIYGCLIGFLLPRRAPLETGQPEPASGGFYGFLGLFWMTAPLAWVYAFPAEHLYSSRDAAWINIGLLVFVATARVLLISRALSVLIEVSFVRTISAVLCISSVIMGFGSVGTLLSLVRLMGGMRHSPEDDVLGEAASVAFIMSIIGFLIFGIACIVLAHVKKEHRKDLPPRIIPTGMPIVFLLVAGMAWIAVLIPQQAKLALTDHVRKLTTAGDYRGILEYLSQHAPEDFSKVHRLPPNPYEYWGMSELPKFVEALDGTEAPWVQAKVLNDLDIGLNQFDRMRTRPLILSLNAVLRLPAGEGWVRAHAATIERYFKSEEYVSDSPDTIKLAEKLKALGLTIAVPAPAPEKKP